MTEVAGLVIGEDARFLIGCFRRMEAVFKKELVDVPDLVIPALRPENPFRGLIDQARLCRFLCHEGE